MVNLLVYLLISDKPKMKQAYKKGKQKTGKAVSSRGAQLLYIFFVLESDNKDLMFLLSSSWYIRCPEF